MAETLQGSPKGVQVRTAPTTRAAELVRADQVVYAAQVAHDTEVRQSANGVRFATFGETGVADLDLDRMLEAVPAAIVAGLRANTYYFVPLALREGAEPVDAQARLDLQALGERPALPLPQTLTEERAQAGSGVQASGADASQPQADSDPDSKSESGSGSGSGSEVELDPDQQDQPDLQAQGRPHPEAQPAMVASAYSDELSDAAICHRNVELGHGARGVFISTRLMGDRFALSFEFFINVAHAFVEGAGVPDRFAELAWKQAQDGVRGETSLDAWESRNLAFGRAADAQPDSPPASARRGRGFGGQRAFAAAIGPAPAAAGPASTAAPGTRQPAVDEKERYLYLEAAFSDAVAIYLLSLALDFDYSELREREYPLLAPAALAARLRLVGELFPPNPGYEFAVRYRRRA